MVGHGTDAAARIAWDMITNTGHDFYTLPEEDKKLLVEQAAKDAVRIVAEVKDQLAIAGSYARRLERAEDRQGFTEPTKEAKPAWDYFSDPDGEKDIRSKQAWYQKRPFKRS